MNEDKPKKTKANGVTTDEEGGSSSDALAEMEQMNKKKKSFSIPKISLNFKEDERN